MIKSPTPNKVPQKFYEKTTLNPKREVMQEQVKMLRIVDSIMPIQAKTVSDAKTGIDYVFFNTSIDRKFGFYNNGEDSIKVRIKDGQLVNNSDYTLVMHKDRIEILPTQRIRDYVRKYPKRLQFDSNLPQRKKKGKVLFDQARVTLSDVYKQEKCIPATVIIPLLKIARGEAKLKMREAAKLQELMNRALTRIRLLNRIAKLKINRTSKHFYEIFLKKRKAAAIKPTKKVAKPKILTKR